MAEILNTDLPQFLEQEFDKMNITGAGDGFAVSYSSGSKKQCVACGRLGNSAIAVRYTGEDYKVKSRKTIPLAVFEGLCKALPCDLKKSGFIFAEDILDGETYLVR